MKCMLKCKLKIILKCMLKCMLQCMMKCMLILKDTGGCCAAGVRGGEGFLLGTADKSAERGIQPCGCGRALYNARVKLTGHRVAGPKTSREARMPWGPDGGPTTWWVGTGATTVEVERSGPVCPWAPPLLRPRVGCTRMAPKIDL